MSHPLGIHPYCLQSPAVAVAFRIVCDGKLDLAFTPVDSPDVLEKTAA